MVSFFWDMAQRHMPEEGNPHIFTYLKLIECSE